MLTICLVSENGAGYNLAIIPKPVLVRYLKVGSIYIVMCVTYNYREYMLVGYLPRYHSLWPSSVSSTCIAACSNAIDDCVSPSMWLASYASFGLLPPPLELHSNVFPLRSPGTLNCLGLAIAFRFSWWLSSVPIH